MRPTRGASSSKAASSPFRKRRTSSTMRRSSACLSSDTTGLDGVRFVEAGVTDETSRRGTSLNGEVPPIFGSRPELPAGAIPLLLRYTPAELFNR